MKGIPTVVAFILGLTTASVLPRNGQNKGNDNHHIGFDCTIPRHGNQLPVFSLGKQATFPNNQLQDILKSAAPGVRLSEKNADGNRYFYDGGRLAGYFDASTGETSVFPKLSLLKPGNIDNPDLSRFVRNNAIIPNDDTTTSIVIGSRFGGSQKTLGGRASPPATYLWESIIQRTVRYENHVVPVCGPGSTASFSFGADGSVKGLTHRWSSAQSLRTTIAPISQDIIQSNIAAQLTAANLTTNVTVQAVDLCFFDSGKKYIQPVYRYNATIVNPSGISNDLIIGYVPAGGKEQEPLPSLIAPADQAQPAVGNQLPSNSTETPKRQSGAITVARYALKNDQYTPQVVVDENAFWNGLSSTNGRFVNSQYYWDEPRFYENEAQTFINSVNVAFTEGHGNVHLFITDDNLPGSGEVDIASSLPTNGFGPGAGGELAYWIIRACDTISTPIDGNFDAAFEPWWQVFNGMHAVMGYRTLAQVYDNEMGTVGKNLALGASVVHGWMSAALGGGKTSAVTVCGHDDDNIYQVGNLGRPGCLQIWWYS